MRCARVITGLVLVTAWAGLGARSLRAAEPASTQVRKCRVYIGTYTRKGSKGIHVYQLDMKTGALTPAAEPAETPNPSFLALHPNGRFLYAVSQTKRVKGERPKGALSAFAIDPTTGALSFLNQQLSHGRGPCHVSVDATGQALLVANYSSGSVASLPITVDGTLQEATSIHQHEGSGADPRRQRGPHAHSITVDPANRFVFAADLGTDKLMAYRLDPDQATLTPADPPHVSLKPGAGPRHIAFHPQSIAVYVVNELDCTVAAFAYTETGKCSERQVVSTLPRNPEKGDTCADIHATPDGRFLYASNRGHDSLACFRIDPKTGDLTSAGHTPTQGKTPRNFGIDPTGTFVLVANQNSDNVVVFRLNPETGALTPTGSQIKVSTPVCVKFAEETR